MRETTKNIKKLHNRKFFLFTIVETSKLFLFAFVKHFRSSWKDKYAKPIVPMVSIIKLVFIPRRLQSANRRTWDTDHCTFRINKYGLGV
jgi:hypothetical protein